jgi:hypothetical protein
MLSSDQHIMQRLQRVMDDIFCATLILVINTFCDKQETPSTVLFTHTTPSEVFIDSFSQLTIHN